MSQTAAEPTPAPAPQAIPAPSRELGYTSTSAADYWGGLADERVPELRFPDAYDVYDQMMDNAQVSSVLSAVMMPILRTGWRIDGTDCREEITKTIADDLALPIVGQGNKLSDTSVVERFSWNEHLGSVLPEYCGYGHSFGEQKAQFRSDGLWHLVKIGYRPPRTITKINVADDGGLVSLEQSATGANFARAGAKPRILGVRRIVVYSRQRKGAKWRGRSMLRPAYQPWLLNNRAERVEMIVAERIGSPVWVYTGPENPAPGDLAAGRKIAREVRSGLQAGAALPYGATLKAQGYEGTLPDLDKTIQRNNEAIARAVLAHFLNLGTQTGSWALGATFADFFTLALQATADDIARTASRHIIRDIVDWNWPGERAPRLVFDEIGSRQNTIIAALAALVSAGVLQPDEDLEQFTRTTLGLPPRDPSRPRPDSKEEQ